MIVTDLKFVGYGLDGSRLYESANYYEIRSFADYWSVEFREPGEYYSCLIF